MMPSYPSPCLKCEKGENCYENCCAEHNKWLNWWWKRFKVMFKGKTRPKSTWQYEHPDLLKQYLSKKPCDSCPATDCDVPCDDYADWFVANWDYHRKRVGR